MLHSPPVTRSRKVDPRSERDPSPTLEEGKEERHGAQRGTLKPRSAHDIQPRRESQDEPGNDQELVVIMDESSQNQGQRQDTAAETDVNRASPSLSLNDVLSPHYRRERTPENEAREENASRRLSIIDLDLDNFAKLYPEPEIGLRPIKQEKDEDIAGMSNQFTDLLSGMTKAFEAIANQNEGSTRRRYHLPKRPVPYTYAGEDHEDPKWFIAQMNNFFLEIKLDNDYEKVLYTADQLQGKAKKWYEANVRFIRDYGEMKILFLEQFDNFAEICRVRRRLQGENQPTGESAVAFISRKRRMCERLMPTASFEEMSALIVNQLEPELGMRVSAREYRDFNELLRWAKHFEERLQLAIRTNSTARYRNFPNTSASTSGNRENPPSNNNTRTNHPPAQSNTRNQARPQSSYVPRPFNANRRPPNPCMYCQGWHYNNECPQHPRNQGNASRTERVTPRPVSVPQTSQTPAERSRTDTPRTNQ